MVNNDCTELTVLQAELRGLEAVENQVSRSLSAMKTRKVGCSQKREVVTDSFPH